MRLTLFVCWALIVAKVTLLVLGTPSPTIVELSYIVAFPVALLNLERGRELLGGWFYVALLMYLALGAGGWLVNQWQRWFQGAPEGSLTMPWLIGSTVLALNFFLLLFFIGRELVARPAVEKAPDGSTAQG